MNHERGAVPVPLALTALALTALALAARPFATLTGLATLALEAFALAAFALAAFTFAALALEALPAAVVVVVMVVVDVHVAVAVSMTAAALGERGGQREQHTDDDQTDESGTHAPLLVLRTDAVASARQERSLERPAHPVGRGVAGFLQFAFRNVRIRLRRPRRGRGSSSLVGASSARSRPGLTPTGRVPIVRGSPGDGTAGALAALEAGAAVRAVRIRRHQAGLESFLE